MNVKKIEFILGIIASFIAFIVYLITLAPTVNFIDSGELAAVAATLGIAHPTGYPLFTLIGFIFSKLPLNAAIIYKLNLMSAFFCSLAVFFFYQLFVLMLKQAQPKLGIKSKPQRADIFLIYIPALSGAMVLGFSQTFWSQAVSIEVYSLHLFFLSVILYFFIKAINIENQKPEISISKYWFVFSLLLGLSFTNHMTTILLLPGLAYLYFLRYGISKSSLKFLFVLIIPFIIGLSFYFYLPIRASGSPILNWGNPIDFEKLFWHVSGKQYRVWIFSSTESAIKQFSYFTNRVPVEFNFAFLIAAVFGILNLFQKNWKLLLFTILLFIGCVGYSINYDIHDIDSYFLLAFVTIVIWIAFGLNWILLRVNNINILKVFAVGIILLPIYPLVNNFKTNDESNNYLVEDYTMNMFNSIQTNGVIISYQWDYFVSASYYYQFVEGYRNDVVVIDKELLRRSWYFHQLENQYRWLVERSRLEIKLFLDELYKFEHGLPYTYEVIEKRYTEVIRSFIEKNIDERSVYVTGEIESQYLIGYEKIPSGLCYQLIRDEKDTKITDVEFQFRQSEKSDKYTNSIMNFYAKSFLENGIYNFKKGELDKSLKIFNRGLEVNPNSFELRTYRDRVNKIIRLK